MIPHADYIHVHGYPEARDVNSRRGLWQGLGLGFTMGLMIATYGRVLLCALHTLQTVVSAFCDVHYVATLYGRCTRS